MKRQCWRYCGTVVTIVLPVVLVGCGSSSTNGAIQTTSASVRSSAWGSTGSFRKLESLAVFRRSHESREVLPHALLGPAKDAGAGRLSDSRLLVPAAAGAPALYAWPTVKNGVCLGVSNGASVDCRPLGLTKSRLVFPFATFSSVGHRSLVYGLVSDGVTRVFVRLTDGSRHRATVRNNGFLCVLPSSTSKSIRSFTIVATGKTTTVPY
jgi:hypothetical protein